VEAVEIDGQTVLRLHVRPAPDEVTTVTLATAPRDPRTSPSVKGPDLKSLGSLRTELDVGEAIILDDGVIAEGAWSSIVWWKNDTLHAVDPSVPRLSGVTERIVRQHATFIGAPVISARVRPEELDGAEVWVLSALHGIRVATEWRDGPTLHIEPGRVDYWRQQYLNQRQVISGV
jgi:branched-subunit amino acid aminotransferase/4-amino-4-deoxychorismate lyase